MKKEKTDTPSAVNHASNVTPPHTHTLHQGGLMGKTNPSIPPHTHTASQIRDMSVYKKRPCTRSHTPSLLSLLPLSLPISLSLPFFSSPLLSLSASFLSSIAQRGA